MKSLPKTHQKIELLTGKSTEVELLSSQNFKKPQQHPLVEFIQTVGHFSQKNADVLLNILRLYFNTLIPYYITLVAT
jgi:hypothetical protein